MKWRAKPGEEGEERAFQTEVGFGTKSWGGVRAVVTLWYGDLGTPLLTFAQWQRLPPG